MPAKARITILCENTIGARIGSGEHGFSAFIETSKGDFLFDTGSGRFIVENAFAFNKDLRNIKKIFLSHAHYDHTGGLPEVLKIKGEVEVHAHPSLFLDRIALPKEKSRERTLYMGIPYKRTCLELLGAQFKLNREFLEVEDGVFLTGEVPRKNNFEKLDPRYQIKLRKTYSLDSFSDDQSLVLDTPKGLVIIFGCAHAGMINIIHHAMKKTGKDHIYGLIGGTHLGFFEPERLEASISALKDLSIGFIGVSHCTGFGASVRLSDEFRDRFRTGHVGAVFEV
jgi:7,8-dihydropterin-6-yl-methyl-4-(beta-D-ribofuranosyl)aminobenzene 5'-phosphate synthase